MAIFLNFDEVATLTGWRMKSKQIAQLRSMGVPFLVNGAGHPVVTLAAVEGRKEASPQKLWIQPRVNHGPKANR